MNVMALLEYLDEELSRGAPVPLTGRRMVDAEKCLDIISELRINLPDDVRDAEVIVREKGRLISDAKKEAEEIVIEAEKRFEQLVSEHEITRAAQMRAQQIVSDAKKESKDIRSAAVLYAEDIFADLEKQLQTNLQDIRRNRQDLHSMR